VTRARMTQMLDLTLLAPDLQERILFLGAEAGTPVNGKGLRALVGFLDWEGQRRRVRDAENPDRPPWEPPGRA
jgi:hypothetical protein